MSTKIFAITGLDIGGTGSKNPVSFGMRVTDHRYPAIANTDPLPSMITTGQSSNVVTAMG